MKLSRFSRYVDVGGIRTHYFDVGSGPIVVLLHSGEFGASAELSWEHNIPTLAERFRVIAPDWLGFGGTDKLRDFVAGSDRMLRHLAAFLRTIAIDRAAFVGTSFGGTSLVKEAARPDCRLPISRMAIISGGGFMPYNEDRRALVDYDGTPDGMRRILRALFHDERWIDDEDYVARRVAASLEPGAWEAVASARLKPPSAKPPMNFGQEDTTSYERIRVPTLALAGANDRLREPGYEKVLHRIPDVEVHVIADAGHLVNIEKSAVVNDHLLRFLATKLE
ncbi:alpha/beta hydrolase [Rhodococcus sp. T2V]|uniref:alpha/beta fold hydrolase n=1 Tax=Rhodococcus sp. T2V TaxID=3034164 RepID=UPI0023E307B9|nr:alpha/beta hydrolase [Rhodococcus sp. T2V]MDF3313176.1 alpha/beta hydrolase [Rhodococcus sp. T2V]